MPAKKKQSSEAAVREIRRYLGVLEHKPVVPTSPESAILLWTSLGPLSVH